MQYKNFGKLSLLTFTLVYLNGCGGSSTPKEDTNITEVNTTVEEENNETQEQEQEREDEEPVVIPNTPPVVDAKDDKSVEVNQNITITAEATDSDGEIISQRWSDEGNT